MSNQNKTDNLNYLVDPTFTKVNRTFVLSSYHLSSIIHLLLK